MSRLYQWNFNQNDWDGYLRFSSNQTTQVIDNLWVNSNINCQHIVADTIDNIALTTTSNITFSNVSTIQRVDNDVVTLSNYVHSRITSNNSIFDDLITLRTSDTTKHNVTTLRVDNRSLIGGVVMSHASSNRTLASIDSSSN